MKRNYDRRDPRALKPLAIDLGAAQRRSQPRKEDRRGNNDVAEIQSGSGR
jgi:hypothetical protein